MFLPLDLIENDMWRWVKQVEVEYTFYIDISHL